MFRLLGYGVEPCCFKAFVILRAGSFSFCFDGLPSLSCGNYLVWSLRSATSTCIPDGARMQLQAPLGAPCFTRRTARMLGFNGQRHDCEGSFKTRRPYPIHATTCYPRASSSVQPSLRPPRLVKAWHCCCTVHGCAVQRTRTHFRDVH